MNNRNGSSIMMAHLLFGLSPIEKKNQTCGIPMKTFHSKSMRVLSIALITLASTISLWAQGSLYLSNLGQPLSGYLVGDGSQSFTTGNNDYILDYATLLMGNWLGGASNFDVSICDDNNGQPGTILGMLSGNSDPETAGQYIYSAQGIALAPNSTYWIVGSSDIAPSSGLLPPGGYAWQLTSSSAYTSSGGWSINTQNSLGSSYIQFSINATPTPEPSAFALGSLAFGLIMLARKARRKSDCRC